MNRFLMNGSLAAGLACAALSLAFLTPVWGSAPQDVRPGGARPLQVMDVDLDGAVNLGGPLEQGVSAARLARMQLSVAVDESVCSAASVQCNGAPAAAGGNDSPVRLALLVQNHAGPVTGLSVSDVQITNPFVPPGGAGVELSGCGASCFQEGGTGLYQVWVDPSGSNLWKTGSYFGEVIVTVPAPEGTVGLHALFELEIP